MNGLSASRSSWLSGLQWFFFIFCNTVVIPPTLQSAFNLSPGVTFCITQYTFISTALACLALGAVPTWVAAGIALGDCD